MKFGRDQIGDYRRLDDGRVLRITPRLYNTLLTVSSSADDPNWDDGW